MHGETEQGQNPQMTGTCQVAWSQLPEPVVHVAWTCSSHYCAGVERFVLGWKRLFSVLGERAGRNGQSSLGMLFLLLFGVTNFSLAFTVEKVVVAHDLFKRTAPHWVMTATIPSAGFVGS